MSMGGQGTKWHRNIAENFNPLSRVLGAGCTNVTDDKRQTNRQTTDGRTTTYSERERLGSDRIRWQVHSAPSNPVAASNRFAAGKGK